MSKNLGGFKMDFKKCSRCGSFYVSNGNVCPKCSPKDNLEFSKIVMQKHNNNFKPNVKPI